MKRILLFLSIFFLGSSINMVALEDRGTCELNVSFVDQECGLMVFTASGFEPGAQLFWTIDGNELQVGVDEVTIQFESNDPALVCVGYETMGCPEGVVWCETITPSLCAGCPEETYMGEHDDCGCYSFEIGSFVDGENVTWNFGDGTVMENEGHFIQHCYEANGEYSVTADYSSPDCEGESYALGVAEVECFSECTDLSLAMESYTENDGPTSVTWSLYDSMNNLVESDNCSFSYKSIFCNGEVCLADGCYTLEVTSFGTEIENNPAFSLTLGEAASIYGDIIYYEGKGSYQCVLTFGINSICAPCGIEGEYDQIDDYSYLFEVEAPAGVLVEWFIDDTFIESGMAMDYTFGPGEYTVCAMYESVECPLGAQWCQDILVTDNSSCPEAYGSDALGDCGCFGFEIGSAAKGISVDWMTSDGQEFNNAGHYQEICFEQNGTYTVTAIYSSLTCDDEEYTFDVMVDCFAPCTEVEFAFDSDVSQGGPFNVQYIITDQNGDTWESGACTYNGEIDNCDASACLPAGCYSVDLYAGDPLDNSNNFETGVYINGSEVDWFDGPVFDGNYHMQYSFSVDGGCEAGDCSLDIQYGQFAGLNYNFTAEASDVNADIYWDFGDGTDGTGSFNSHTFPGPGEYEVCASYETDLCPEGVTECVTLYIEEEACTFVSVTVTAELTGNDTDLLEFVLENEGVEIEGEWPLIAGVGTFNFDFCLEDGCYTLAVDPATAILANFIDIVISDAQGNEMDEINFDTGDDNQLIVEFGVNTNCEDNVDELFGQNVSVFPVPVQDQLQINLSRIDGTSVYEMVDTSGKLVKSGQFNTISHNFSVSSLASGVYLLRVIGTTQTSTVRVVVD